MALSQRIRSSREYAGLTQKELADRVSISQTAVHKLECGRSRSSRRTVAISLACGVNPIWLETGQGDMLAGIETTSALQGNRVEESDVPYFRHSSSSVFRIPVITWKEAGLINDPDDLPQKNTRNIWMPATRQLSRKTYALVVTGDSMENEFSEGDIIIVDPMIESENKSFVVIRFPGEMEATFKQLVIDAGQRYLKPLNSRYPLIRMEPTVEVCGVVVSKYKEY